MTQAFILGAGLGTRLQPLTRRLPKPLVPLFHRSLAEWTMAACERAGIGRFAVNTHHLPEAWAEFGEDAESGGLTGANGHAAVTRRWRGHEVSLFHEPVLLETGGGLKNIASWIGDEPVLVHNGDIFSTMDLGRLVEAHEASGLPVTLALRSEGEQKRIALDDGRARVTDVRGELGRAAGTHVFSGVYCMNPGFLDLLARDVKVPVIPAFLDLTMRGELGAVVLDEGVWLDLGDRESYLRAHRELALDDAVHADAVIGRGALVERSVIGPGASIGAGAMVRDSVVWPGGRVCAGAVLDGCIVYSGEPVSGTHRGRDL